MNWIAILVFGLLTCLLGLAVYLEYLDIKHSRIYEGEKRKTIPERQRLAEIEKWEEKR